MRACRAGHRAGFFVARTFVGDGLLRGRCCKDYRAPKGPVWPDEPKLRKRNNGRSGTAIQVRPSRVGPDGVLYFPVLTGSTDRMRAAP